MVLSDGQVFFVGASTDLTAAVVAGADYHVVAAVDPTGNAVLYVNGTPADSATYSNPGDASLALTIGYDPSVGTHHFDGAIDEVAIYDRVLTAAEIAEHYAVGTRGA